MQYKNAVTKVSVVMLFALIWFAVLFAANSAVGIYFSGRTLDAWVFLLATFVAFFLPSALFAVGAKLLSLPLAYTTATVLGLLIVERLYIRQYHITDWSLLTLLNLSTDIAGFVVGAILGGVVLRNERRSKVPAT
jgi:uncharacterized membrane protein YczE